MSIELDIKSMNMPLLFNITVDKSGSAGLAAMLSLVEVLVDAAPNARSFPRPALPPPLASFFALDAAVSALAPIPDMTRPHSTCVRSGRVSGIVWSVSCRGERVFKLLLDPGTESTGISTGSMQLDGRIV